MMFLNRFFLSCAIFAFFEIHSVAADVPVKRGSGGTPEKKRRPRAEIVLDQSFSKEKLQRAHSRGLELALAKAEEAAIIDLEKYTSGEPCSFSELLESSEISSNKPEIEFTPYLIHDFLSQWVMLSPEQNYSFFNDVIKNYADDETDIVVRYNLKQFIKYLSPYDKETLKVILPTLVAFKLNENIELRDINPEVEPSIKLTEGTTDIKNALELLRNDKKHAIKNLTKRAMKLFQELNLQDLQVLIQSNGATIPRAWANIETFDKNAKNFFIYVRLLEDGSELLFSIAEEFLEQQNFLGLEQVLFANDHFEKETTNEEIKSHKKHTEAYEEMRENIPACCNPQLSIDIAIPPICLLKKLAENYIKDRESLIKDKNNQGIVINFGELILRTLNKESKENSNAKFKIKRPMMIPNMPIDFSTWQIQGSLCTYEQAKQFLQSIGIDKKLLELLSTKFSFINDINNFSEISIKMDSSL